jgi:hypothetical protein
MATVEQQRQGRQERREQRRRVLATRVRRGGIVALVLAVTGTPAFFVNGFFLSGAKPFEAFKEVIDRELASQNRG